MCLCLLLFKIAVVESSVELSCSPAVLQGVDPGVTALSIILETLVATWPPRIDFLRNRSYVGYVPETSR